MTELDDIKARVIGILTASYTYSQELGTVDNLAHLVGPLIDGFGPQSLSIDVQADQPMETLAESVATQVIQQLRPMMQTTIAAFSAAFVALCLEYKLRCPDADIEMFLQQLALDITGS